MYPITPQKLGPGIVIGSERIITSKSEPTRSRRHGIWVAFFPGAQQCTTVVDRWELLLGVRRLGAAARACVRQGGAVGPGGAERGKDGGAVGPGPDRCHLEGC